MKNIATTTLADCSGHFVTDSSVVATLVLLSVGYAAREVSVNNLSTIEDPVRVVMKVVQLN